MFAAFRTATGEGHIVRRGSVPAQELHQQIEEMVGEPVIEYRSHPRWWQLRLWVLFLLWK